MLSITFGFKQDKTKNKNKNKNKNNKNKTFSYNMDRTLSPLNTLVLPIVKFLHVICVIKYYVRTLYEKNIQTVERNTTRHK